MEFPITRRGELSFIGEIQSKNTEFEDAKFPYSASIRWQPGAASSFGRFSASVGIQRQGLVDDSGLFAQVGYTFGRGADDYDTGE